MFATAITLLKSNPLIAGGAGMAVVGWAMMQAKTLPLVLWRALQDQFSTTVTIYSEDTIFRMVDLWLARHPSAKHSRRFGVASWHNRQTDNDDFALTPGAGLHLLREGWRFFLVSRHMEQEKSPGDHFGARRKQTISVTTMGRSQAPLNDLICRIKHVHEDHETIPVYLWTGFEFSMIERRVKRSMDTVYANAAIKEGLIADVRNFLARRSWYAERGIPYRRGYMFEGPPGTGKTTMIFALASLFEKAVYIINPAAIDNDNTLQKAVNSAGANMVVIEDIDSLAATEDRETLVKSNDKAGVEASKAGITLSGLLNAVDGIGARDGRMLFITTNHPENLDAALIRPGRIDRRVHLDHAGVNEATAMFEKFFPCGDVSAFQADIERHLPIAAADLQNRLLGLAEAAA